MSFRFLFWDSRGHSMLFKVHLGHVRTCKYI
jgi:hypothetical protein